MKTAIWASIFFIYISFANQFALAGNVRGKCLNQNGSLRDFGWEDGEYLGFDFRADENGVYKCVNRQGQEGLNPNCIGACGNLRGKSFNGWNMKFQILMGADLSGADLRGTQWRGAVLQGAKLVGVHASGADFVGSSLEDADFRWADLTNTFFGELSAGHADFRNANFVNSFWAATDVNSSDFRGARMAPMARFSHMLECVLPSSCMAGAKFDSKTVLPITEESAIKTYMMVKVEEKPTALKIRTNFLFKMQTDPILDRAIDMVHWVFDEMGVALPNIVIEPGSDGAWTQNGSIHIGENLAYQLPDYGIAQVIMHEAGHIYEGHTGIVGEAIEQLFKDGLISRELYEHFLHEDEYEADLWGALGAWAFDPNPAWPAMAQWLWDMDAPPSDSHPGSRERAELIADTVADLYTVETNGFFSEQGFDIGGYTSDGNHYPGDSGDDGDDGGGGNGDDGGDDGGA